MNEEDKMFDSIEAIVDDMYDHFQKLKIEDRVTVLKYLNMQNYDLTAIFWNTGFLREIRNRYHLWSENCMLTRDWILYPESRTITDGVDFSSNHPDQVAAQIRDQFVSRLAQPSAQTRSSLEQNHE